MWVSDVLAAWAARYVEAAEGEMATEALPDGIVEVEETGQGRYTQRVRAGTHILAADEPVALGGDDLGPGPYEYLLAALGACTAMTLRMYAERKGWPVARIGVRLRHEKIHAEDCADCETREGRIDEIFREIDIGGELDEDRRAQLIAIAQKCPVHRTLTSETKIRTSAAD